MNDLREAASIFRDMISPENVGTLTIDELQSNLEALKKLVTEERINSVLNLNELDVPSMLEACIDGCGANLAVLKCLAATLERIANADDETASAFTSPPAFTQAIPLPEGFYEPDAH